MTATVTYTFTPSEAEYFEGGVDEESVGDSLSSLFDTAGVEGGLVDFETFDDGSSIATVEIGGGASERWRGNEEEVERMLEELIMRGVDGDALDVGVEVVA